MLLLFMARTGARRKREGEHCRPDAPGDPEDRLPDAIELKIFQPCQSGDQLSEHPGEASNPTAGLDYKSDADQKRLKSNSLPSIFLKAGRLSATQFTNRRSRTLFTSPSIKNIATIFDPPELISGSGMPVTGIRPTTIPTFTNT